MSDPDLSDQEPTECGKEKGVSLTEGNLLYSKLQCLQCGKCLSVKPVSEDHGQYVCGRCCPNAKQCLLYATVAEHFTFPCIFRDCEAELKWGYVKSHEKTCVYRDVSCPFPECVDTFQYISYQSHFEDAHALHKEPYCSEALSLEKLSLSTPYVNLHCMFYKKITFLVFIKIYKQFCCENAKGVCLFNVFSLSSEENDSNLNCEISININPDFTVMKSINCNDLKKFIDTQHCLGCLNEFCDKPNHTNIGNTFLTEGLEFPTTSISFSYSIKVCKKNSLKALPCIECPICNEDFSEPIYLCPTGHSLCSNCFHNVDVCPFCRTELADYENGARNFALEELIRECIPQEII